MARADSFASLAAITRAVGFVGTPDPLDGRTRRELGISDDCRRASIQRWSGGGSGALRALLLDMPAGRPLRDRLTRIALRLSNRGSPLLWLICGTARDTRHVAVAAIDVAPTRPRVRALVTDCARVTESDADTLAALAATAGADDVATYARWLEVLGREAVTRRFFLAVARHVGILAEQCVGSATGATRHEMALVYVTRLLFLAFLESKGWLDGNRSYLVDRFAECMLRGGRFHERVLLPLFFGTLNTRPSHRAPSARALGAIPFLNGGLFARSGVEKRARLRYPDDAIGAFLDDVLTRYRFTSREQGTDWSEAAIDPEMLGKAFESLMATRNRRGSGAFYTPHVLVAHVTESAFQQALAGPGADVAAIEALLRGERSTNVADVAQLRARSAALRLLDPACGSGAFLVHALERMADLHATLGDARPRDAVRRAVLTSSIFGVDLNPMAVWLCQLRLWLSCVIDSTEEDVHRVQPLPNLDCNIRVGDSLLGEAFRAPTPSHEPSDTVTRLRLRYARATGRRKNTLARALDGAVRRYFSATLRSELEIISARRRGMLMATRGFDLFGARRRALPPEQDQLATDRLRAREIRVRLRSLNDAAALPFAFPTHFADVVDRGGFDIVLGNPPWVRPHNLGPEMRQSLRRRFVVLRDATWRHGAALSGGAGFGGQADIAAAFVERALALVRDGGTVALLVPGKLWKSLAGGGVRRLLLDGAALQSLEDWSDAPAMFAAAVYPSLIVVRRDRAPNAIRLSVHRRDLAVRWKAARDTVAFDDSSGSPWVLLPPDARAAFDRLAKAGVPLHACGLGRVTLGVKTGCNAAFIVGGEGEPVEPGVLRPLLRGEDVVAWRCPSPPPQRIIWTHGANGRPLERLAPRVHAHLAPHRYTLEHRSDARGAKWWALFRTEGARYSTPRVVWADLTREPRAAVLHAGDATVPLNTCYVVRCKDDADALTLAALLNSPLAAAWLGALAGIVGASVLASAGTPPNQGRRGRVVRVGSGLHATPHATEWFAGLAREAAAQQVSRKPTAGRPWAPNRCPTGTTSLRMHQGRLEK